LPWQQFHPVQRKNIFPAEMNWVGRWAPAITPAIYRMEQI
jgi:hypothetical protein